MAIDQIPTGLIKDNAVTTAKIINDAVTAGKIVAGAVDADIAAGSVDTAQLAADAVDGTKLADNAVNSEHITALGIDTAHLGNLQVTAAKVATDVATTAGSQTLTNKTLTGPVMTAPVLGTPASGVATNLTSIPAAAVGGVLPVGVTGGSGLTALGTVVSGNIGKAVETGLNHVTTINLNANPYTGTAGGTANVGGDVIIHNLHTGYDHYVIYFDEVAISADSEWRMKLITGTNSSGNDARGFLSHTGLSGMSNPSGNWYQGVRSGPDQDGATHTSSSTNTNRWMFSPARDLLALGDSVLQINVASKKTGTSGQVGRRIYAHAYGTHPHTTTALGPYESSGTFQSNQPTFNGLHFQCSAGIWDSGKIRVYGRRSD